MTDGLPLVSIVLPTLNGSRYISTSIRSCLTQTYERLELIVVDGGSTDNTLEIVRSFADPRIRIVAQSAIAGRLPGALNDGFAQASGSLYTWTQDDDFYAPEALAVMASSLQAAADIGFVYAGFWYVDEAGQVLRAAEVGPPDELKRRNSIGHCFLYRSAVAKLVGQYDPAFLMAEDIHYWVRVYQASRMRQLPGQYSYHRLHGDSLTVRDYGAYQAMRVSARARRQVLKIPWHAYRLQLADAFIQEAFAAHANASRERTLRCVLQGVVRNPLWLTNRGVLSIWLRAMLPSPLRRPKVEP